MRLLVLTFLLVTGCVTTPPPIEITYEKDHFGVPTCVANGVKYPMTLEERQAVAQAFVNEYCPATEPTQ